MSNPVRRVVTGHDAEGKAVFASDSAVEPFTSPLAPGLAFHQLWNSDTAPKFPDDGSRPATSSYFPPVGGFRFNFFTLPPDDGPGPEPDVDVGAALTALDEALPGLFAHNETEDPGMHTTATIDFEVVLSGEVTLELDDGAVVHLQPGDTVVQNGTRHKWGNPGTVPATIAVFLVGAHHDTVG